jgi:hypothetical protein
MTGINTDTLEERLNAALSRPSKRSMRVPIRDLMTCIVDYFSRPSHRNEMEPKRPAYYRAAAG